MMFIEKSFIGSIVLLMCSAVVIAQSPDKSSNQTGKDIYSPSQVTEKIKIISKPEPSFTDVARNNGTEGTVILKAVFAASGQVVDITPIKELPDGLTDQAIKAARKIRFKPAHKDGKPVSVYMQIQYHLYLYHDAASVTRKPVITSDFQVPYTDEARSKNLEGTVIIKVGLIKDGSIQIFSVIKGLPYGLTENVIDAIKQLKFKPAELNGRRVSYLGNISYKFSLK